MEMVWHHRRMAQDVTLSAAHFRDVLDYVILHHVPTEDSPHPTIEIGQLAVVFTTKTVEEADALRTF